MGTRVHKVIGYGLTDLKEDDARLNKSGVLFEYDAFTSENYLKWLNKLPKKVFHRIESFEIKLERLFLKEKKLPNIDQCFVYGTIPNTLCIYPMLHPEWCRYDDPIDYYEEIENYVKEEYSRVELLDYGVYPYVDYADRRTGKRLDSLTASCFVKEAKRDEQDKKTMTAFAKHLGFKNAKEALKHIAPKVPYSIVLQCVFGKVFNDISTAWTLQPMICTYWC